METSKGVEVKNLNQTKLVNIRFHTCYDVYIGRPSKWGNPFSHIKDKSTLAQFQCDSRQESIIKYIDWITKGDGKHLLHDLHELQGKTLGCWCSPNRCHGEVLIKLVSQLPKQ